MSANLTALLYLVSGVFFILALRGLSSPESSRQGNAFGITGMAIAIITTLLVAVILYAVGTGPVKGFAVTLSIGIITSMFTAIMGTRAIINLIYGGRRVERLAIG